MAKIEVEGLSKIFGPNPEKALDLVEEGHAKDEVLEKTGQTVGVNNVDFDVDEQEIFVIMGLSGSGKSTLLRCLNRLIEPTEGTVKVDGVDITDLDSEKLRKFRREEFGMVFQNFGLFPHKTVLENTEFGLEIQGVDEETRKAAAEDALAKVGLDGWEQKHPDELSGGMQQRVGLARALAVDPEVLLMDEPFSALDPLIKREMQDNLLDLYDEMNKTIIFITHDLDEALKLGDRIAIMKDGEIVQVGTHEDILTDAENDYVRDFVKDVNRSRLLNAKDAMIKPRAMVYSEQDGPRAAMHKMRHEEISSIFVVGKHRQYQGIVKMEDVLELVNKGKDDLSEVVKEVPTASPQEDMDELFSKIANLDCPLPVVNDNNKLIGIIVKSSVLSNLSSEEVV
ncbi:quaternary amine ABC transporter ATP-binding protein [Halanaerobacter jeridensis]|uniref:Quaternary amine transport ATP-binding protein n=1 Tax=Halanaerobacter jeridensis TaxID=706427 RepID=A0A938XUZ9_9FIRM|nr:glycine betaine/proline transport system ATP-binding protein [Halanaerobacter jeridensis]